MVQPSGSVPGAHGRSLAYRTVIEGFRPICLAAMRRDWRGAENLPRDRGFVVVANHITLVDPATLTHYLVDNGCPPHYLAKRGVFHIPVLGSLLGRAGQIPVDRGAGHATETLDAAAAALAEGKTVVIFPEGTTTKDPGLWPMRGKSGAARLALATGCPVIPVGHWGEQRIMPRGTWLPDVLPRHTVTFVAGKPVPLEELIGRDDPEALRDATDRIMAAITGLVEELRGEIAPRERFDPARAAST